MSEASLNEQAIVNGRTFVWHELYVPNRKAAIEFYTEALGFGSESMDMGEMGSYHMLTREGRGVCGVVDMPEMNIVDVPPHWATYIAVDDVDARLAKCQELGAKAIAGPMDVPTVGRMALIADPQGAYVWLFTPSSM